MSHPVVIRVAKLKRSGNIAGSLAHTFRTRDTPNADPALRGENRVMIGANFVAGVESDIKKKIGHTNSSWGR